MTRETQIKKQPAESDRLLQEQIDSITTADHRPPVGGMSAGHHQLPVLLKLIRIIVVVFNHITTVLSRAIRQK